MSAILGKKIGMTQIFDEKGNVRPVTVVEAGPCIVTALRTKEKHGYNAIQVGFGPAKKVNKPMQGMLKELKLKNLREFRVEKPEDYKIGQEIKVDIFKDGDSVKVSGVTIGKGFQGTIKRWHHHRGPMGHGSKSHRIPGSIGSGTTPGRVYKGRRMSGHMGAVRATLKNVKVVRVDLNNNLILVSGSVPGSKGNLVEIVKS
ncbi:50S ribosomal protein L3 [Candidatus Saganbacteria bacterium]|nr:50S ribosomal protein L3 [Candidatus Saganbacteria bacterium]